MDVDVRRLHAEGIKRGMLLRAAAPRPGRRLVAADHVEYIDFATTSYLGLAFDERCRQAFVDAAMRHGLHVYCTPIYHRSSHQSIVEEALAGITGYERAVVFTSVSALHAGVLPLLSRRHSPVLVDEEAHQSIHDALRLGPRGRVRRLLADRMDESTLGGRDNGQGLRPLIVTDGVFSMSGRLANLRALGVLADAHDAVLYVDDSHGFGVLGDRGEGMATETKAACRRSCYVGSLGKALPVPCGFIAADDEWLFEIRSRANTQVFSGNISIPCLAAAAVALEILQSDEGRARRTQLAENVKLLCDCLRDRGGLPVQSGAGIVTVPVTARSAFRHLCIGLQEAGIAFNPVTFPAVRNGEYRLRFCVSSAHTKGDIERLADTCAHLGLRHMTAAQNATRPPGMQE